MVTLPTFHHERELLAKGYRVVAGVDEAGCGAWAGPIYAAAVILPFNSRVSLIRDSKKLSASQREVVVALFKKKGLAWGVGVTTHEEVDALNVRVAGALAMRRAVEALAIVPDAVLSDAFDIPGLAVPCFPVIRGDLHIKSVAAASIIAKVERDAFMQEMDATYPGYAFADHKGYGTKAHQDALARLGPCAIHRKTYAPVSVIARTPPKAGDVAILDQDPSSNSG